VATSLPELGAKRYGFGTYIAADYDELIDHPVEMGDFALATFKAHGIRTTSSSPAACPTWTWRACSRT
jgi:predicted metalloprotease with PDZ domain